MKTFLAFILACLALTASSSAQVTVLPLVPMNDSVTAVPCAVPPGATMATVTVECSYVEFYALENVSPQRTFVHQEISRSAHCYVYRNEASVASPAPYGPFIASGVDIYSWRNLFLSEFDGTVDYDGRSGSIPQANPSYTHVFSSQQTIPVSQLDVSGNIYVQLKGSYQIFNRAPGCEMAFIPTLGATVTVTYR